MMSFKCKAREHAEFRARLSTCIRLLGVCVLLIYSQLLRKCSSPCFPRL